MDPKKRPNSTDTKKKMEIINPGKSKLQSSSKSTLAKSVTAKPTASKPLRKASNSNSPSTTFTDFSFNRPISASEKQKLELLTSDPLSFSLGSKDFKDLKGYEGVKDLKDLKDSKDPKDSQLSSTKDDDSRSEGLRFIQATLDSMLARNQEREFEEAYEEMLDSLDQSEMNDRLERMKKLNDFAESLKTKRDDEGNLMIDMPEDYEEILEMAVEYKKMHSDDPDVSWIQVYQARQEHEKIDLEYRRRRDKIKQLDIVLKEKEKMLLALKTSRISTRSNKSTSKDSESPSKNDFFLTKVKTKSVKKPKVYSEQDFVKKNIEFIEEVKQGSMITRLSFVEQQRLAEIEKNLDKKEEFDDLLMKTEIERLEEIDKSLRTFIPQIEWEKKSVSTGQYSKSTKNTKQNKVKPGDPVLREAQERREAFSELNDINSRLTEIQNMPDRPIHQDDLKSLLIEHGYDFSSQSRSFRTDPLDQLISEGKEILHNIEKIDDLDLEAITQTVQESDKAMQKFESALKQQAEDLAKSPEFLSLQSSLLNKCEKEQKICENTLDLIENLDKKVKRLSEDVKKSEDLEKKLLFPIELPNIPEASLEDIDQEIESKIESSLNQIKANFSDLDDITPENFPALYHVYEKVLQSMPDVEFSD